MVHFWRPRRELSPQITPSLSNVKAETDIEHFKLKFHIRADYVGNRDYFYLSVHYPCQYPPRAAGYVLKPSSVSRMLAFLTCSTHAVISAAHNLASFQANPTLTFQIKRFNSHVVHVPIQASTAPLSRSKLNASKLPKKQQTHFRQHPIYSQIHTTVQLLYDACDPKRRKFLIVQDF